MGWTFSENSDAVSRSRSARSSRSSIPIWPRAHARRSLIPPRRLASLGRLRRSRLLRREHRALPVLGARHRRALAPRPRDPHRRRGHPACSGHAPRRPAGRGRTVLPCAGRIDDHAGRGQAASRRRRRRSLQSGVPGGYSSVGRAPGSFSQTNAPRRTRCCRVRRALSLVACRPGGRAGHRRSRRPQQRGNRALRHVRVLPTDERRDAGGVWRGHRRPADPDVATAPAHHGAVRGMRASHVPGRIGARPAGEDAPRPNTVARRLGASPPGAATSTGVPTFE